MRLFKKEKGLNFVSFMIYFIIIFGGYAIWKYGPVYWQRENLSDIIQNTLISAKRLGTDGISSRICEYADRDLNLKIKPEDIKVMYDANRAEVELKYTVTVEHPFGYKSVYTINLIEKRDLFN